MQYFFPFVFFAACGSLGLLGCGGGAPAPTPAPTPAPEPAPVLKDIVELAQATATLSTLVQAVVAADLAGTLKEDGPFTVFAPNDAAFAALPEDTLANLLKPENKAVLADLLLYHVVPGKILAGDLAAGQTPATELADAHLVIKKGAKVTVNGAEVTTPDVLAKNGVVHIVNAVILNQNIAQKAAATTDLSTLAQAVTMAELDGTLSDKGPFTVFAPSNDAFAALPDGALANLLKPENKAELVSLLKYHVISGRVLSTGLAESTTVPTLAGPDDGKKKLTIKVADGIVTVGSNSATVSVPDVGATNGVVHIVDAVLADKDIVELAQATATLSTLVTAVVAADLAGTLKEDGPFTVFAPDDAAFADLPDGELTRLLLPANKAELADLLLYHVVPGKILAGDLAAGQTPATELADAHLVIKKGAKVTVNGAEVTTADQFATNGVVHIVNAVILNQNIVQKAVATPTLSTLVTAVTTADLGATLSGPGPFTVFAPSNDAFAALPDGALANLLKPENKAELVSLLLYHVISGRVLSTGLAPSTTVPTLEGPDDGKKQLTIKVADGTVTVGSNSATVIAPDVGVTNGVVHIIDKVLTVPTVLTLV